MTEGKCVLILLGLWYTYGTIKFLFMGVVNKINSIRKEGSFGRKAWT